MSKKEEKRKQLNLLKDSFESNIVGKCVFDETEKIISINKSLQKMLERNNKSGIVGFNLFESLKLIPKNDLIAKTWKNYIETEISTANFTTKKTRDYDLFINDQQTPVEVDLARFINDDKKYYLLTIKNISEEIQKRKTQDEFISVVSHEMRTPIASMNGYLDLVTNESIAKIDDRAKNYINLAKDSSSRLNMIFKDILDVSRLDNGKTIMNPEIFDICQFIQEQSVNYITEAKKKEQNFELNLEGKQLYIKADKILLKSILDHILENAFKYTNTSGLITVKTWYENERAKISITDSGIGIDEKELQKIFHRFYRSEKVTVKESGTGLGLYIAKTQTELMGGKIEAESELGQGTTFTLSFPTTSFDLLQKSSDKIKQAQIKVLSVDQINNLDPFKEDLMKTLKYPKMNNNIFINNYIKSAKEWLRGEVSSTSPEEKAKIKKSYEKLDLNISEETFNDFWRKIDSRFDNIGTAKFSKTMVSSFIFPWAYLSPKSAAWEMSFGWAMDFSGKWRKVPKSDPAYWMLLRTPGMSWTRERTILSRYAISGKDSVLFIKAGCLPELRYYKGGKLPKEIIACDDDVTVPLNSIFGWVPSEHNVEYHRDETYSFLDELDSKGKKFDIINMTSGSCQYHDSLDKLIPPVVKLLKPGGKFMFDIQPSNWDMDFSIYVLGVTYPNANTIPKNVDEVILNVMKICEHLPDVEMKYHIDSRNDSPAGIMFYIEKK